METRLYKAGAVQSVPSMASLVSEGYPTGGNPAQGIPATKPGAAWFYGIGEEIRNAIEKLGGTPSRDKIDQLADTLLAKFALKADLESPVFTGDVTVPDPVQDHNPVTKAYLVDLLKRMSNIPTGAVLTIAGDNVPEGFLLCNGATLSRTTYSDLFAVIGTLYGAGDGATTFNLPDMRDRFAEGAGTYSVGTAVEAGLPNITGTTQFVSSANTYPKSGAFSNSTMTRALLIQNGGAYAYREIAVDFNASKSNLIYDNSTTVQPSSLVFNYIIKY